MAPFPTLPPISAVVHLMIIPQDSRAYISPLDTYTLPMGVEVKWNSLLLLTIIEVIEGEVIEDELLGPGE